MRVSPVFVSSEGIAPLLLAFSLAIGLVIGGIILAAKSKKGFPLVPWSSHWFEWRYDLDSFAGIFRQIDQTFLSMGEPNKVIAANAGWASQFRIRGSEE